MNITILGRQNKLSLAEIESFAGSNSIAHADTEFAIVKQSLPIELLGGIKKIAHFDFEFSTHSPKIASDKIFRFYRNRLPKDLGKITLGISWYNNKISPKIIQKIGLDLKRHLKKHQVSLRLLPNQKHFLSTATSYHNKLGQSDKKVEIVICQSGNKFFVGRTIAVQDIDGYTKRDRQRPKRDARVGMLPPKLAQIIINLSRPQPFQSDQKLTLLDPFCGTGVMLQEAHLANFKVYGTDIEPRMIEYTEQNLQWLSPNIQPLLEIGDATNHQWQQSKIDCLASETYLGHPFKSIQPDKILMPEKAKIEQLLTSFLTNLKPQISDNTKICIAVPAWLRSDGSYLDLNISKTINLIKLGYKKVYFKHINANDLIYYRPDQIVARRLLVLQLKSQK